ncbi:MAG: hypothetical protein ABGY75_11200, partial [Gemmataceae bacterium]
MNAVHRLIQYLDVLAIALNQFRQLSFQLPAWGSSEYTPEKRNAAFRKLTDDYIAVKTRMFPREEVAPHHTAMRLANDAVAAFASVGREDAEQTVRQAQQWLGGAGFGLPATAEGPPGSDWEKQFNAQGECLFAYVQIRADLLSALARTGRTVPPVIHNRVNSAFKSLCNPGEEPISVAELTRWIDEAQPAGCAIPPRVVVARPETPTTSRTGDPAGPSGIALTDPAHLPAVECLLNHADVTAAALHRFNQRVKVWCSPQSANEEQWRTRIWKFELREYMHVRDVFFGEAPRNDWNPVTVGLFIERLRQAAHAGLVAAGRRDRVQHVVETAGWLVRVYEMNGGFHLPLPTHPRYTLCGIRELPGGGWHHGPEVAEGDHAVQERFYDGQQRLVDEYFTLHRPRLLDLFCDAGVEPPPHLRSRDHWLSTWSVFNGRPPIPNEELLGWLSTTTTLPPASPIQQPSAAGQPDEIETSVVDTGGAAVLQQGQAGAVANTEPEPVWVPR